MSWGCDQEVLFGREVPGNPSPDGRMREDGNRDEYGNESPVPWRGKEVCNQVGEPHCRREDADKNEPSQNVAHGFCH